MNEELKFSEILKIVFERRLLVCAVSLISLLSASLVALTLPNVYTAEITLSPVTTDQKGALGALAGQFGGLAALAGVNIGSVSDKSAIALKVLESKGFIGQFVFRHNLQVPLFAAKGWDPIKNSLEIDESIYDERSKQWVRKVSGMRKPEPSILEAHKKFMELLAVQREKKSDIITISVEFYSPYSAKEWLDLLISDLNSEMKMRDISEAKESIGFLERQIQKTSVADVKAVLYQLIEEQTKTLMFAEVRDEYVFKTIDATVLPEEKSGPRRTLIGALGLVLGFLVSGAYVVAVALYRKRKLATEN